MLAEVMLLTLFCIAIFALLALQLYMGALRQKCVAPLPKSYYYCNSTHPGNGSVPCFTNDDALKMYWLQDETNFYKEDGEFVLCGSNEHTVQCPDNYFCAKAGDNPNWNYTNFDNFGWAMLNSFQLVTLDFWEDTYNKIVDVSGPWNMLFFTMVVLLGSFYLLNLMLAVVAMAYTQEADEESKVRREKEEEERAKAKRKENTALLFNPKKLKEQLLLKHKQNEERNRQEIEQQAINLHNSQIPQSPAPNETLDGTASPERKLHTSRPITASGKFLRTNVKHAPVTNGHDNENMEVTEVEVSTDLLKTDNFDVNRSSSPSPTKTISSEVTASVIHADIDPDSREPEASTTKEGDEDEELTYEDDLPPVDEKQKRYLIQKFATLWLNRIRPEEAHIVDRNCLCCAKSGLPMYHGWMKFQNIFYKVASDGLFELFIMLCIVANTVMMATEHYNVCELCTYCAEGDDSCLDYLCAANCNRNITDYTKGMRTAHFQALNIANVVFTIIFTVEAIIKLTALSKDYFRSGWNIFDLVIVIFSLPDLVFFALQEGDDIPGLSEVAGIVKIFRLMRIIKLAQSWSTMRTLLSIIFSTMGALLNLCCILIIIIFIFAVLGNQILGEAYSKYTDLETYPELADMGGALPRWHFHTFHHSALMVFRTLCGEWVEPLWDCMRVNEEIACILLFLLTLILGNFMVLNLFLALLLNSFSADNIKNEKLDESQSKVIKTLQRFKLCFSSCCNTNGKQQRVVTPTEGYHNTRRMSRLEVILSDNRKPSIVITGSHLSLKSTEILPDPKLENRLNSSTVNMVDEPKSATDSVSHLSNGDLKPYANGHTRSNSISSVFSNGTANGVIKNKSNEMSYYNLQQIDKAFTLQRDQYAKFESAVNLSAGHSHYISPVRTPIIIAEDFSGRKSQISGYDDQLEVNDNGVNESREQLSRMRSVIEEAEDNSKEEDVTDGMVTEDGHVIVLDCMCAVCHRNPKLDNCCPKGWRDYRLMCAKVVTHRAFEAFTLFLIAASSVTLCFEDIYLHEKPLLTAALNYLNIVFAVFFFTEMLLKWFALGLKKYFTSFWAILDFIIVCVSIVDIAGTYAYIFDISAFRSLRTLRALRPLRAISRWEGMKIVVNALIFALPAIGNVLLVCFVFWLIFVILGVQTFRGKFYECRIGEDRVSTGNEVFDCATDSIKIVTDASSNTLNSSLLNISQATWPSDLNLCNVDVVDLILGSDKTKWHWARLCYALNGEWYLPPIHFDHVGHGYLALFQTATFEGWMEVMLSAIDTPSKMGQQPWSEASIWWYLYFVIFIVFGAFFTLNLFIGVIIDNFNVLKKKYDGSYLASFLTVNQRHYYNTLKKLGNKKPQKTIQRPKNHTQGFFYDIAVNTKFELAVTIIIFLNMIAMMIEYEPGPVYGRMTVNGTFERNIEPLIDVDYDVLNMTLKCINIMFTVIFLLEAVIKIIGLRLHYFRRAWNVFDFVIVFLSVIGIVLDELMDGEAFISPTLLRVVRVFRIGRVLRLVKAAKGIRKLLFALIISIPALFNVATLLFLFMFIYAIVGMTFFSNVRRQGALTSTVNFETFGRSMVLMFRISTSAGWNDVLYPLMDEINCNKTHYIDSLGVPQKFSSGNCGNQGLAVAFFVSYLFVSFMIIINMYIAVILENFSQAHEQEEIGITEDDFDMFYATWEKYDPLATQYIKLEHLSNFISDLEEPLGIPKPNSMAIVSFNLPIVEGDRLHCLDILMALVKRVLRTTDEDLPNMTEQHREANEKLKQQIADKYSEAFPQRQLVQVLSTTMQRKKEDVAAKTLQRAWRKHKMKQNILRIKELAIDQLSTRGSVSRRVSDAISSIKSRVGSAISRLS